MFDYKLCLTDTDCKLKPLDISTVEKEYPTEDGEGFSIFAKIFFLFSFIFFKVTHCLHSKLLLSL